MGDILNPDPNVAGGGIDWAEQMRGAAKVAREHGSPDIAKGNDLCAEYIEGLECGLAAERKLTERLRAANAELVEALRNLAAATFPDDLRALIRIAGGVTEASDRYMERIDVLADRRAAAVAALAKHGGGAFTPRRALADIESERKRQVRSEGWTEDHDDAHGSGELADAAACYAAGTTELTAEVSDLHGLDSVWPWESPEKLDQKDRRRQLVIAGALIVAEIERLDRAAAKHGGAA